jgi:uncharacterized cupin superfamily protein
MKAAMKHTLIDFKTHPPYLDDHLKGELGYIYSSMDDCFGAVYWRATGPGYLLEKPQADELICILEGQAIVDFEDEIETVGPGDVILWLVDNPMVVFVPEKLFAFCATYHSKE